MLVDFGVLFSSLEVWVLAFLFTTIVLVGKTAAAKLSQWIFRLTNAEFGAVTGLTIPQAAATLAVTLVGFEVGLFSQNAVNAVIVMILITCIIGPMLVENYGRRMALAEDDDELLNPSIGHQRILVPLANPSTATALIDLAMLIRDPVSTEPMHPLIVARDGADVHTQVAASEKMLGHAVIHATAANIPVLPVTRVDLNISSGIVRAIKELRISAVVIGWNGQVSTQQRIFGSVLDQMLHETSQLVLVCKLDKPVNTNSRIVLIIPPLLEREIGFAAAVRAIKLLSTQIGAAIHLYAVEEHLGRIRDINNAVKPDLEIKYHKFPSWNKLMTEVSTTLTVEDLCVLLNAKEGAIGWQPGLNRLPRTLAATSPKMNLIVVYPSENRMDPVFGGKSMVSGGTLNRILDSQYCTLNLDGNSVSQAIHQMMARFWSEDLVILDDLKAQVMQSMRDHLPELTNGVLLLHAHSDSIPRTMLLVGIHPDGLDISGLDHKIHIVFVLLSPVNRSPQQHLQNLANIARMVRSDEVVEEMKHITTTDELERFLGVEERLI
jgi:mannitol/fructose-specific phosphotransferase system IIA component (Ntr-type)